MKVLWTCIFIRQETRTSIRSVKQRRKKDELFQKHKRNIYVHLKAKVDRKEPTDRIQAPTHMNLPMDVTLFQPQM